MAAAIIPLIAGLAPGVINLIASLVHGAAPQAESLGTGTGPVKFATVFGDVMGSLTKAAEAGSIPKVLPSDDTVKMIIQAVVSSMQLSGTLKPAAVAPSEDIVLRAGQAVRIRVE